jgi:hypothetical protein
VTCRATATDWSFAWRRFRGSPAGAVARSHGVAGLVEVFEQDRGKGGTWSFDEIQQVDGWQPWLRAQLERPRNPGSSCPVPTRHCCPASSARALRGRHHLVELFPFDYGEFRRARPWASLRDCLTTGGFPAVLAAPEGDRLLQGYFNDIVERDMRERVGARSTLPLRQLVQMLYEAAGSELSARRLATAIGVTDDTTSLYLQAAEAAYLAFACPFFAWSARKRAARQKKYYPVDTGLRRAVVTRTGEDRGKQLECGTFLALRRRYREVFYWRGRGEVDFLVLHENRPLPVQVSWDGPQPRHQQALDAFYEAHRDAHAAVFVTAETFADGLAEQASKYGVYDGKRTVGAEWLMPRAGGSIRGPLPQIGVGCWSAAQGYLRSPSTPECPKCSVCRLRCVALRCPGSCLLRGTGTGIPAVPTED